MARSDWAALLTEPAAEYIAQIELRRFGVEAYLPQFRKRYAHRPGAYTMRCYPLFPRYLLISIGDTRHPAIHMARGVCRYRPVLASEDGRPWRAPNKVIDAIRAAEQHGYFDQIMHKGDSVTVAYGALSMVRAVLESGSNSGLIELLTPLFGGSRATIRAENLTNS